MPLRLCGLFMFLYNLSIHLFGLAIRIASHFNPKAKLWIEGRKNIFEKLKTTIDPSAKIIWFHVASLGEFEQGRPVIECMRQQFPQHKILLTFFSPSGYEIRKNYAGAESIFYLPLDTKRNAQQFIAIVKPQMAIFVKYEFWIHYINALHNNKIPIYSISSIFRADQIYFKSYGKFYADALKKIAFFFVQNEESKKLLQSIERNNVMISGDTRFDRVAQNVASVKPIPVIEKFVQNKPVLIAGSTWPKDEALLLELINQTKTDYKFIIAPHQIHQEQIDGFIKKLNVTAIKFSKSEKEDTSKARVMIIDNVGMLTSIYQYGSISYIGGGFGAGIHNILEPSVFMMPVLFGPNYHKFQEAHDLLKIKSAFVINNALELIEIFNRLAKEKQETNPFAALVPPPQFEYFKSKVGATNLIVDKICSLNKLNSSIRK